MYSTELLTSKNGVPGVPATRSSPKLPTSGYLTASSSPVKTREHSRSASIIGSVALDSNTTGSTTLLKLPRTSKSDSILTDTWEDELEADQSRVQSLELHPPPSSQLLRPRKTKSARSNLVSNLVTQILCSYAERRLDEISLPPFIHHSTIHRSAKSSPMNNAIAICQGVTLNYASHESTANSVPWNAIVVEQERIYTNRSTFDKSTTMDSAQALTIYLLMAASSGETVLTQYPNIPITLLYTLGSLFVELNIIHPGFSASTENGRPPWQDWVFAESKLRTAAMYFIFAMCFDVQFGIPCDRPEDYAFQDVDLPASKMLWEASDGMTWEREMDLVDEKRNKGGSDTGGIEEVRLKYGDLVKYNRQLCEGEGQDGLDEGLGGRIEKWQRGADEFGILVSLCSTMI